MLEINIIIYIFITAIVLDAIFGDPSYLSNPVIWFGKLISFGEKKMNRGSYKAVKGALLVILLFVFVAFIFYKLEFFLRKYPMFYFCYAVLFLFYGLAAKTLLSEVNLVFRYLEIGNYPQARIQLSRLVTRDTQSMNAQQISKSALETLSENLSDGVVAPLFYFALGGVPGIMLYKLVNTLDSMIGYKTERYKAFGMVAARFDDVANFLPARITALLVFLVSLNPKVIKSILTFGSKHESVNSGYPEAAFCGALDCQFGGSIQYNGIVKHKALIGFNDRQLDATDGKKGIALALKTYIAFSIILICFWLLCNF
ncbi:MAG: cobalamin biosynthesis protein CobD [Bacteroidales bacterium]|nr:cobalamin biosynthesis protein CobD [Bacteroidales bacterium]